MDIIHGVHFDRRDDPPFDINIYDIGIKIIWNFYP